MYGVDYHRKQYQFAINLAFAINFAIIIAFVYTTLNKWCFFEINKL